MYNLTAEALDFAMSHVESFGDTDVLPTAFEFQAIRHQWTAVRQHLLALDLDAYQAASAIRCLAPKGRTGFRVVTQLDPYDTLILTALVRICGEDIESVRATPEKVVSYRISPDDSIGRLYDPEYSHSRFTSESVRIAQEGGWVVVTDIADFFPRIYSHRLENMLEHSERDAFLGPARQGTEKALRRLLKSLNQNISRGLPVGTDATRVLADLSITNIDRALETEGFRFLRYSDDYRIFVPTERDGYRALAFLADQLDETQILNLQAAKTYVVSAEDFVRLFGTTEDDRLREDLDLRIAAVRDLVGLGEYETLSPGQLTPAQENELRGLELYQMLDVLLAQGRDADLATIRAVVEGIGQLGLPDEDGRLITAANGYPALFRQCVRAWGRQLQFRTTADWQRIRRDGARLFGLLSTSTFGHLAYHRAWVLEQATRAPFISSPSLVAQVARTANDELTMRYSALAMWAHNEYSWFQSRRSQFGSLAPWVRRAFLLGTTCLPGSEAQHFHRAVQTGLSHLEKVVLAWATTDAPQSWRRSLQQQR